MLRRSGLGHVAGNATGANAARVTVWPQVLSYASEELMPTGRESSLPNALMRGVYVAESIGQVQLVLYDPRSPLDAMEVQDALNAMYSCAFLPAIATRFPV